MDRRRGGIHKKGGVNSETIGKRCKTKCSLLIAKLQGKKLNVEGVDLPEFFYVLQ
jgi:hypothetical protein